MKITNYGWSTNEQSGSDRMNGLVEDRLVRSAPPGSLALDRAAAALSGSRVRARRVGAVQTISYGSGLTGR
jgi:hypothetical protein